eukprot:6265722-Prymnesium_polylepis.1
MVFEYVTLAATRPWAQPLGFSRCSGAPYQGMARAMGAGYLWHLHPASSLWRSMAKLASWCVIAGPTVVSSQLLAARAQATRATPGCPVLGEC